MKSSTHVKKIFCMNYETAMATNFEPQGCMIFAQSTKIGTHVFTVLQYKCGLCCSDNAQILS